jgi:hypothetical protein
VSEQPIESKNWRGIRRGLRLLAWEVVQIIALLVAIAVVIYVFVKAV